MITVLTKDIENLTQATTLKDWGLENEEITTEQNIILAGESSSSLDLGWHLIKNNALPFFGSVLTLNQSSGRGQLRRNWVSPKGNIYAAWHLPLDNMTKSQGAAVIIGSLFCSAFQTLGYNIQLKWINDLVLNNKKIGGILLEEKNGHLLVGIGININSFPDKEQLRKDHALIASSLATEKQYCFSQKELLKLWLPLIQGVTNLYNQQIKDGNLHNIFKIAEKFLAFKNQSVVILPHDTNNNEALQGVINGLDLDGSLLLKDNNGKQHKVNYGSLLPFIQKSS
ncbi:biotin--[acetyl-CoA-carboxylase] ligase [Desulfovibrio litoralis]|uniref:BirA family transcriptional regulator, biotin operon repressor / biotin-[acetyl-CoA-carboxylase] ligase n=1 Tax=Desulfovibrio litoralis DSM 11393 TaxID=1121455 RepID=A0A1M7SYZ5_9BACT|nr:biotin--[acetyl-CoA-carboxylase] ligase [Desulfovibrio litoralis]SHN63690.1 BirA family transcriptional regulator, biotin operon repressor / biotin-[acetyl-CoA-carboxylase] ligase [Desulfovibrio litoralis DSM 11393]